MHGQRQGVESQFLFMENLNAVMAHCGHPLLDFVGLMANEGGNTFKQCAMGGQTTYLWDKIDHAIFTRDKFHHKHTNKFVLSKNRV